MINKTTDWMSWMFRVMKNPVKAGTKKKEIRDLFFFTALRRRKQSNKMAAARCMEGTADHKSCKCAMTTQQQFSQLENRAGTRERERERERGVTWHDGRFVRRIFQRSRRRRRLFNSPLWARKKGGIGNRVVIFQRPGRRPFDAHSTQQFSRPVETR